jgi:hypothetical protein
MGLRIGAVRAAKSGTIDRRTDGDNAEKLITNLSERREIRNT